MGCCFQWHSTFNSANSVEPDQTPRSAESDLVFVDSLEGFQIFKVCDVVCARLFICALWSPAGKGLTSWLSFVVSTVSLSLSHWYPGSGVVRDCIDS